MMEVVKGKNVKENEADEIKKVKKDFTISHKAVRRVLLAGVGTEVVMLCNHGYNFYKSGIGIVFRFPYCQYTVPYWFLVLAILAPGTKYFVKGFKKIHGAVASDETKKDELANLIGKHYDK